MVDGSKLSHSSLSDGKKIVAAALVFDVICCPRATAEGPPGAGLVGVWGQSCPRAGPGVGLVGVWAQSCPRAGPGAGLVGV